MNLRTGVDLIELERVETTIQRHGERFLERVFTSQELVEAGENVASLAARFAMPAALYDAWSPWVLLVLFCLAAAPAEWVANRQARARAKFEL